MSWRIISSEELERIMPVTPPVVNRKINPIAHKSGVVYDKFEPCNVANHLNTLIPVGTAIIIVAAVK